MSAEQRMLALVSAFAEQECREAAQRAEGHAAGLRADAWHDGRRRLHDAITSERARARERIQHAQAELETARRRHRQHADARLLADAWPRLAAAVAALWGEPEARRRWIGHAARTALAALPPPPWAVEHPADWTAADAEAFVAGSGAGAGHHFTPNPAIPAGLRIRHGDSVLDMTADGLLRDRAWIDSRLLALCATRRAEGAGAQGGG